MDGIKVSIITIVYNNQACIADCIQSVIDQSYPYIEHIVIDGGSTDGTQQQIEPFQEKLAYYQSEKDNGLYDALNKGILQATGDIIGILHSDDLYYAGDTIQKVVNAFRASGADLVHANGQFVAPEDTGTVKRIYPSKPYRKRYLRFGWIPLHTTIYVKRELYEKYGLYDESYSIASDYEISLRWFKNDEIKKYFLNEWVVKMRLGGKSTSAKLQKKKSLEDLDIIRRYNLPGYFTLAFKIARKIPQYLIPRLVQIGGTNPSLPEPIPVQVKATRVIRIREALEYWGKIPRITAFLFGTFPREEIQIPEEFLPDHLRNAVGAGMSPIIPKGVSLLLTHKEKQAIPAAGHRASNAG